MTRHEAFGTGENATSVLEEAEKQFLRLIRALNALTEALERGEVEHVKDSRTLVVEVRKATQTAFDERKKLEESRRKNPGACRDYTIDLGAARREIASRLDRLRAEGGSGGVS